MDEVFTFKQDFDPTFKTDADRAAELGRQAELPFDGKMKVVFAQDTLREKIVADGGSVAKCAESMDAPDGEPDAEAEPFSENSAGGENVPPRPSRTAAYNDVQRQKDKSHAGRNAARRVTGMAEHSISAATQLAGMGDDFDTYSANDAGIQATVAGVKMEAAALSAGACTAWNVGRGMTHVAADLKDGTITAKEAATMGRHALLHEGKKSATKIGSAGARTALQYMTSFQEMSDDFAGAVPGKVKDTAFSVGYAVAGIRNFLLHPVKTMMASLKMVGIVLALLLVLVIVSAVSNMMSAVITTVLCADDGTDVQPLVQNINDYRNEAITEELYTAFQNDVDPNGNSYGYATLTGRRSNNLQHGVTWSYANGISNNTAEIISLAAVYYQQEWPNAHALAAFDDATPFTQYCRALAAYGLNVTAQESSPYSCMAYGGCVNGYRSEGETVTIQDYRQETHTCSEGNSDCGSYGYNGVWHWGSGHGEGESNTEWVTVSSQVKCTLFRQQMHTFSAPVF